MEGFGGRSYRGCLCGVDVDIVGLIERSQMSE